MGYWAKSTYDNDGRVTYYETSNGYWSKSTYKNGKMTYYENSNGFWIKTDDGGTHTSGNLKVS